MNKQLIAGFLARRANLDLFIISGLSRCLALVIIRDYSSKLPGLWQCFQLVIISDYSSKLSGLSRCFRLLIFSDYSSTVLSFQDFRDVFGLS